MLKLCGLIRVLLVLSIATLIKDVVSVMTLVFSVKRLIRLGAPNWKQLIFINSLLPKKGKNSLAVG